MNAQPFEKELKTYDEHLQGWIDDGLRGKWVVIKGDEIVSISDTDQTAFDSAILRFGGNEPFFMRQIGDDARASFPVLDLMHLSCR